MPMRRFSGARLSSGEDTTVPFNRMRPAVGCSNPAMQRRTVVLRYWLGFSVEETADELGIREGTVKSHASRGLAALRILLAEETATR